MLPKSVLKEQVAIAKEFSPIGKFPDDFPEWFQVCTVRLGKVGEVMLGVFATRDIEAGMLLAEYRGDVTFSPEADGVVKFDDARYVLTIKREGKRTKYIDALDTTKSSWSRYINTMGTKKKQKKKNNAEFVEYNERAFVESRRLIKKGQQVFIEYDL
jgi:hypothetical protein